MSKGRARLGISRGVSVWVLEAPDGFGDAAFHSHHAIQITVSLSGSLSIATADETASVPAIAVAADVRHRFEAQGLVAFIFVEPESLAGRTLASTLLAGRDLSPVGTSGLPEILEPLRRTFDAPLGSEDLLRTGHAAVGLLAPDIGPVLPDARIQKIIDYTARHLDEPLSLASASHGVYLSPSRLRHLFVQQTGLPYKSYVLWLRLMSAVQAYSEGKSLTEAAHRAGFSDSAHFSRTFLRMFGLPATTLTRL